MKRSKVLIVEDEAWLAEQQRMLLEKAGYEVEISPHAHAAILQIDTFKPDAIILDVLLPGGTAFALLHELQSYDDIGSVPIIICSGAVGDIPMSELEQYGVKKVLDKTSMKPEDIIGALRSVL